MDVLCGSCFKAMGPCEEKTIGMVQPRPCAKCGIPIEPWSDEWHAVASPDIGHELLAMGAADFETSLKSEQGLKHTLESCIHIMETSTAAERPVLDSSGVIGDFNRVVTEAKLYPRLIERALDLENYIKAMRAEIDPEFKNN